MEARKELKEDMESPKWQKKLLPVAPLRAEQEEEEKQAGRCNPGQRDVCSPAPGEKEKEGTGHEEGQEGHGPGGPEGQHEGEGKWIVVNKDDREG